MLYRKIGNKFVWVYSGYSGPDYGLSSTNSALRYAYGDTPLGPWKSGGVLVDSRAVVLNEDGTALQTTYAGHNTHGSIEKINDQWYAFYHRAPRGFGNARQPMVAPVTIEWDEASVADGGKVVIRAYDPYAENSIWTAKDSNGNEYKGAEVTSEGFNIYGLDPYKYYSAGYASYLSDIGLQQDSWDIWDNDMPVSNVKDKDIVGYKYFGFGGLDKDTKGLKAFKGTEPGNETSFNLFLRPRTDKEFKVNIMLDGPWENNVWNGKKIGEIKIPANSLQEITKFSVNVSEYVDNLDKKNAIYLVAEGNSEVLVDYIGLGFSSKNKELNRPIVPKVSIMANGELLDLPETPVRSTNSNGITEYNLYEATYNVPSSSVDNPNITATSTNEDVKIDITQGVTNSEAAIVNFDYKGVVKTYKINLTKE